MAMQVDWELDAESWRTFLARCPNATFYHGPGWYEARRDALSLRLMAVRFRFIDDAEALLPLAVRRTYRGLSLRAFSGIETGYGGLVSPVPLLPYHVTAAYDAVRRRFPDLVVTGNPHEAYDNVPLAGARQEDITQVLAIHAPGDQAKVMSSMRARHLKKAYREGLSLEVVEAPGPEQVGEFFALYAEHAAAWDYTRWVRDEDYFHQLCRHASENLVLFLARHHGMPVGFHLVGLSGDLVIQLHLATSSLGDRLNAGTWLIAESLAWSHAHGYARFDFLPSGRLEGVRAYKASFGAHIKPLSIVNQEGWFSQSLAAVRQMVRGPGLSGTAEGAGLSQA